uniref:RING-type domain-containing protein n=1 Tax=Panagrolaimus sp. ES5 TaxID=591445 RepID=A0AC34GNZ0_9BILA
MEDDAGASELSCPVCKGFLIDAVTLTLCSHSFCRSCLLRQLQNDRKCPECNNQLNDIKKAFFRDTTLQSFVYKYVPSTFWKEIKQRSDFIKKQSPTDEELQIIADWSIADFGQYLCLPDEMLSFSVEFLSRDEILKEQLKHHTSPSTSEDSMETTLPKKSEFCRYFRCPAGVKIKHLKSLLEGKLVLPDNYVLYFIELDSGEIIEESYSLQDLVYIFGWTRQKPFKLHFTLTPLVPEEDKPPVLEVELIDQSEAIDSGPPPLELEPTTKMPAFTVNLSTSFFDKEHKGACINGGILPRPAIITPASDMPPKKKRRMGPRKEKPAQLKLQSKRNSLTSAPAATTTAMIVTPTAATPPNPSPQPFSNIQSPQPQQQQHQNTNNNNMQTLSPSLTKSPPTTTKTTAATMNGIISKGQSPPKNFDQKKLSPAGHSSTSSPINGFSKLATSSPTLLTVEQSNKQLSQVLAPIHSAPNTPIPNEFHEKPNIQTVPLSKSADKNRDDVDVIAAMRQKFEDVRTKMHENNFILANGPNFLTMPRPQIFP